LDITNITKMLLKFKFAVCSFVCQVAIYIANSEVIFVVFESSFHLLQPV